MTYIYGSDVSRHQTDTVVKELAAGGKAQFVIARASIGSYTEDAKLKVFAPDIKAAGLKNSYYAASYAKNAQEAVEEADFICDLCEKYGNPPELAIFFDWEYFSANYIKQQFGLETTPQLVQAVTEAFCERVKQRGYTAGVYLNKDYWDRFYTDAFFANHPDYKIWYARPGYSKPDKQCDIWQYGSDNGADFGYTGGNLDKNILLTGYLEEVAVEPMKPLADGLCRMKIGYASAGDLNKLKTKIEGLGIACEAADGFIITGEMSKGDQCYIMVDCNALGVPYEVYNPQPPEEESAKDTNIPCKDCAELKERIAQMEANHKAETDGLFETLDGYIQDMHQLKDKLKVAQETAEIARSQMEHDDFYIQQLKNKIAELERAVEDARPYAEKAAALEKENGVMKETIISLQEQLAEAKQPQPEKKCLIEKILDIIFGGA
ncbi:MAG: hypothetical protein IJ410_03560 [Oscillospiraceae bacterium]|nr:hypothetical protein [Oscillospiraceae bacterium]